VNTEFWLFSDSRIALPVSIKAAEICFENNWYSDGQVVNNLFG
jgi:hypothetical protein